MLYIKYHKVAFLEESIIASGLPMRTDEDFTRDLTETDMHRAMKLGNRKPGTGHDKYLKGIEVFLVIKAPEKFWLQWETYNFQNTVSSTSKMHMMTKIDLDKVLPNSIYPETKKMLEIDIKRYNKAIVEKDFKRAKTLFQRITDNAPEGYGATRAVKVNYMQLKTMYLQRKNHKLDEWVLFCNWILTLPKFKELTGLETYK